MTAEHFKTGNQSVIVVEGRWFRRTTMENGKTFDLAGLKALAPRFDLLSAAAGHQKIIDSLDALCSYGDMLIQLPHLREEKIRSAVILHSGRAMLCGNLQLTTTEGTNAVPYKWVRSCNAYFLYRDDANKIDIVKGRTIEERLLLVYSQHLACRYIADCVIKDLVHTEQYDQLKQLGHGFPKNFNMNQGLKENGLDEIEQDIALTILHGA